MDISLQFPRAKLPWQLLQKITLAVATSAIESKFYQNIGKIISHIFPCYQICLIYEHKKQFFLGYSLAQPNCIHRPIRLLPNSLFSYVLEKKTPMYSIAEIEHLEEGIGENAVDDKVHRTFKLPLRLPKHAFMIGPILHSQYPNTNPASGMLYLHNPKRKHFFSKEDHTLFIWVLHILEHAFFNRKLYYLATHDFLTGVRVRDCFARFFNQKRHVENLGVLMLDIDFFKKINDTYGHHVGDLLLQEMTKVVQLCLRDGDVLTRYGGEEFAILLNNVTMQDIFRIAERIRSRIETKIFICGKERIKMTVSIGITQCYIGDSWQHAIHRADVAMYTAKNTGRNKVCCLSQ